MLKHNKKKFYIANLILLSMLALTGCKDDSRHKNTKTEHYTDGINAFVYEINDEEYIQVIEQENGLNKTAYREIEEMVDNKVDYFTLTSPKNFSFNHFDDLKISNVNIVSPDKDFDFFSLSNIDGIKSMEFTIDKDTDVETLFKYLAKYDFSNVDIIFDIKDHMGEIKFNEFLRERYLKFNSVTITSPCFSYYDNLKRFNTKKLTLNVLCKNEINDLPIDLAMSINLNANTENLGINIKPFDKDIEVVLSYIKIDTYNQNLTTFIDKDSGVDLIVRDDVIIDAPENLTICSEDVKKLQ